MPTPRSSIIWKTKQNIIHKYKPLAYRSGLLVQKYWREYFENHKNDNAYIGNKQTSNMKRWFDEEWVN